MEQRAASHGVAGKVTLAARKAPDGPDAVSSPSLQEFWLSKHLTSFVSPAIAGVRIRLRDFEVVGRVAYGRRLCIGKVMHMVTVCASFVGDVETFEPLVSIGSSAELFGSVFLSRD
jgi:hypothetical protein